MAGTDRGGALDQLHVHRTNAVLICTTRSLGLIIVGVRREIDAHTLVPLRHPGAWATHPGFFRRLGLLLGLDRGLLRGRIKNNTPTTQLEINMFSFALCCPASKVVSCHQLRNAREIKSAEPVPLSSRPVWCVPRSIEGAICSGSCTLPSNCSGGQTKLDQQVFSCCARSNSWCNPRGNRLHA